MSEHITSLKVREGGGQWEGVGKEEGRSGQEWGRKERERELGRRRRSTLSENTTSLQEKGKHFTEQRIWKIFTQVSFHFRLGMRQGWYWNEI